MTSFLLVLMLFYPDGSFHRNTETVSVKACVADANGVRVEDSTCGVKACLLMGNNKAKAYPGDYQLICKKVS